MADGRDEDRPWQPERPDDLAREADRRIAEELAQGRLRENRLWGRPLEIKDNPFDGGMGMAYRALRNAGFTRLPWMEDEDAIRQERQDLARAVQAHVDGLAREAGLPAAERPTPGAVASRHRRFLQETRERLAKLRRRIADFNLAVPIRSRQVANVNVDRFLADIADRAGPWLSVLGAEREGDAPADPRG